MKKNRIGDKREKIYELFHSSNSCAKYFFDKTNEDEYAAYYTAMYLLQDSTESLWRHREEGFNNDELLAYIEIWGVLQAIIIQQDSIETIYKILTGKELKVPQGTKWFKIRNIRNLYSGHPVNRGEKKDKKQEKNIERSFMGRNFGGYDELTVEVWNKKISKTEFRNIELGKIIDEYTLEASSYLQKIINIFPSKWP